MSAANTDQNYEQGRFGPPPTVGVTITAVVQYGDRWSLRVSSRTPGQKWECELAWAEASREDVLEAAVVELYRLLRLRTSSP